MSMHKCHRLLVLDDLLHWMRCINFVHLV